MTVLILWIITIYQPLLQLAITSYLHWWQLGNRIGKHCGIYDIVESQYLMCLQCARQYIKHYLCVHCRTSCYRSILTHRTMFGRYSGDCNQPTCSLLHLTILRIFLHIRQQEVGSAFQYRIVFLQEIHIACIQVVLP